MRASVIQMCPGAVKSDNIAQAGRLIDECLAADRPDLVSLPEMWTCLGGDRATKQAEAEVLPPPGSNEPGGGAYAFLRDLARDRGVHVHGGSLCESADGTLFNTTLVFDPQGREVARYRKIHLFDITTPDGTGYRESSTYGAGSSVVTCMAGDTSLGLAVCYDVRFPELFLALRRNGAELILLPSAFTVATGRDHWEALIRARAIETQCWVAAAATWGEHRDGKGAARFTYGHSLICDPWGTVVARVSDGTGFATARIDPALTARTRANMPVLDHRRLA
ncbi:MAG: carbon-nitrogen hydrolase family protein [Janthinobacterium lividum]